MLGEDWTNYGFHPAPRTLLCQFRRRGQGEAGWFVGYAKDFAPEFNIVDFEWRLTGIAKEELDQMGPEGRAQVMPQGMNWIGILASPVAPLGLLFYSAFSGVDGWNL